MSEPRRTEPRRPEPTASLIDQMRERVAAVRDRVRARNEFTAPLPASSVEPEVVSYGGDRDSPFMVIVLVALGAALLAAGGFWGWQTWSQRSDQPIDELLPELVMTGEAGESAQSDELADATGDGEKGVPEQEADSPEQLPVLAPDAARLAPGAATPTEVPNIIVHVSGAVRLPGIVRLAAGSRVFEAVELTGGPAPDADLDRVNLAAPMTDGERIHIPALGDDALPVVVQPDRPSQAIDDAAETVATSGTPAVLDINTASSTDFMTLPGIGPSIAAAMTRTRAERGPFLSVDELLEVPGIGDAKLSQIRPFVRVGDP